MFAVREQLVRPRRATPASGGDAPGLGRYAWAGLASSAVVVGGAVAGGSSFVSHLPGAWFFGMPGGPLGSFASGSRNAPAISVLAVYGGLAALGVVWFRLLRELGGRPGARVRAVVGVVSAWSAPFLLAPPLFSRDLYSYAGQGAMVTFGIDPYRYGPGVLGATRFDLLAGPLWANAPSPYGPTFLSLDGLAAKLSGNQVLADLVLLRVLAVIGVALVLLGLPTLARSVGRDPAHAALFGAGSPLVLATLVGGAHNDALMLGLLVAGLAAWKRFGPVPGIVLCALAAGVKAPAALGIVLIGWNWEPAVPTLRRIATTAAALAIGAGTLAGLSAVTGIGWGWVLTLTTPDKVSTGVTPVYALARVVAAALHVVGWSVHTSSVRSVTSAAGVVVAAAAGTVLLWRSPRLGELRALGGALLLLALLGPVLWAWYMPWGIALLAVVADGWLRRALVALSVGEAMIGAAAVAGIVRSLEAAGAPRAGMVVIGIVGTAFLASRLPLAVRERPAPAGARLFARRLRAGGSDPLAVAALTAQGARPRRS